MSDIGHHVIRRRVLTRLSQQSGELAADLRLGGELLYVIGPLTCFLGNNRGFPPMIEDRSEFRMTSHPEQQSAQMIGFDQRIEYKIVINHRLEGGVQTWAPNPLGVRYVLNHRPQPLH